MNLYRNGFYSLFPTTCFVKFKQIISIHLLSFERKSLARCPSTLNSGKKYVALSIIFSKSQKAMRASQNPLADHMRPAARLGHKGWIQRMVPTHQILKLLTCYLSSLKSISKDVRILHILKRCSKITYAYNWSKAFHHFNCNDSPVTCRILKLSR